MAAGQVAGGWVIEQYGFAVPSGFVSGVIESSSVDVRPLPLRFDTITDSVLILGVKKQV